MADSDATDDLIERARVGDDEALAELFESYRGRLRRMVQLRLDRRLAGRVDPSDILQDGYLEVRRRFND